MFIFAWLFTMIQGLGVGFSGSSVTLVIQGRVTHKILPQPKTIVESLLTFAKFLLPQQDISFLCPL